MPRNIESIINNYDTATEWLRENRAPAALSREDENRLDEIRERLHCGTPTTDDVSALLVEVERLRARLAKAREVTEEKVKKGGVAANDVGWTCYGGAHEPGSYHECPECKKVSDQLARCVLTAALGGGDNA